MRSFLKGLHCDDELHRGLANTRVALHKMPEMYFSRHQAQVPGSLQVPSSQLSLPQHSDAQQARELGGSGVLGPPSLPVHLERRACKHNCLPCASMRADAAVRCCACAVKALQELLHRCDLPKMHGLFGAIGMGYSGREKTVHDKVYESCRTRSRICLECSELCHYGHVATTGLQRQLFLGIRRYAIPTASLHLSLADS